MDDTFYPTVAQRRWGRTLSALGLAAALVSLTGGCASPVKGPTDPKEFMVKQRQWTSSGSAAAPASASEAPPPISPDTIATPDGK